MPARRKANSQEKGIWEKKSSFLPWPFPLCNRRRRWLVKLNGEKWKIIKRFNDFNKSSSLFGSGFVRAELLSDCGVDRGKFGRNFLTLSANINSSALGGERREQCKKEGKTPKWIIYWGREVIRSGCETKYAKRSVSSLIYIAYCDRSVGRSGG